jgi:hypothetical protein
MIDTETVMPNGRASMAFTFMRMAAVALTAMSPLLAAERTPSAQVDSNTQASVDNTAELAKKLVNPVASLTVVPFENDFEFGGGPKDDGFRYTMKLQPVIPISLNERWNLISRTILPFVHQSDMIGNTTQSGLSDTLQSVFFSPKTPTRHGLIWGAGPVLLLPTATDDLLGTEKFGLGPTAVVLKQSHGWTYGTLVNQIWSVAGESSRDEVNATYLQPFLWYTTKHHTTFGVSSESTYDWEHSQWTAAVIPRISQLLRIGRLPVEFKLGVKYYADKPNGGPDWGMRFTVTFLFPK